MIEIVHYSPQFEDAHHQFAVRYWKKRKRTTAEYIYWKFRGNNGEKLNGFILATENEKVIGQLGLIPCKVQTDNQTIEAQWACDLMVDTSYRGKGVAKLLYDYAYSLKPLTLGSDPSPAAAVSMKRAGFIALPGSVKFLFPMNLGEITKLKGIDLKLPNILPNPLRLFFKIRRFFRPESLFTLTKNQEIRQPSKKTETADEAEIRVFHDREFLDWRINPFGDYYKGVETYKNPAGAAYSLYRAKDFYIVTDYSAASAVEYLDVFGDIVRQAADGKVRYIKLMGNSEGEIKILSITGFIRFRTPTEIIFYCADENLKKQLVNKKFRYTYLDSDENI